jgi:phosphoglycerol transferase MdoB-like AlkP superfamily enzyme
MSIEQKSPDNTPADGESRSSSITDLLFFALLFAVVFGPLISIVSSFTIAGILGHISAASTLGYFSALGQGTGLSFAIIFILIFTPLFTLRYLSLGNVWLRRVVSTCLAFFLIALQIIHHAMYYEFGEGINSKILYLFRGDALTIFNFLNAQYSIWAVALGAMVMAFVVTIILEKIVHAAPISRSKKGLVMSLFVLPIWAAYGIYHFNFTENLQSNNFPKMGEGAYLSGIKTMIKTSDDHRRGYKHYLTGLTPDNNATLETAVSWVKGNQEADRPSRVFHKELPTPPFRLLRKPSHLFFLQLESHDGIVLENEALRVLSPNLNRFKDTGIYVPHFFEGSGSTNSSIMSIVSGYPGLRNIPKTSTLKQLNVMHLVNYMKAQGYRCSSHSAAKFDACRHGMFLEYLGFAHTSYSDNYKESEWADAWGISDEKFATDFLQDVDNEKFAGNPQFVFWKNHSNHSPYSVDVFGMGFDPSVVSKQHLEFFKKAGYDPTKVAGHYWFADKQVGLVVDELYRRHPNSLFIIMADHHSRYSNDPSDPLSMMQLPFIMWGPNVIPKAVSKRQDDWYGTHMDVFPSLLSLLSPEERYYSLYGSPLWDTDKYIYTTQSTGDQQYILLKDQMKFYDFRAKCYAASPPTVTPFLRRSAGIRALSHQVMYSGDSWEQPARISP